MWQWLLLASIPPLVVLLYFLKLKRQPLEVPSTYLWHRTIEDLHVNSLWQRLRQNLLLFLQLLVLLLALLACLRPTWEGSKLTEDRYIFLVDTSASMSTKDDGKTTRLELAKEQLEEAIKELESSSSAMIISFSDVPIVEQPFTGNSESLLRRARAISQTQRRSNLDEALRVAAGLANPGRTASDENDVAAPEAMPATLMIFSDGRFRSVPEFAMGNLKPIYIKLGEDSVENVGIVAFDSGVSPERPDQLQIFARIQNFGKEEQELIADLVQFTPRRALLDSQSVKLPAGGVGGVEFTVDVIDSAELRLELNHEDAFDLDDTAYAAVNPRRRVQALLLTSRNDALEVVLNTPFIGKVANVEIQGPEFLEDERYTKLAGNGEVDLIIYDRCRPKEMPQCNTIFIGEQPVDDRWTEPQPVAVVAPQIIDTNRTHPIMRFVEMGDVMLIANAEPLNVPTGGTILVDSNEGPLIALAPRQGFEDLVVGFPIVGVNEEGERYGNTDWPIRVSFPVFMGNALNYLGGTTIESRKEITRPGMPVALKASKPIEQVKVTTPTGQEISVPRDTNNNYVFTQTENLGSYIVREPDADEEKPQRFAVNLFDEVESNVVPAEIVTTKYEDIEAEPAIEPKPHDAWKYFLIAGLIVLMIEWYIYNRRVYI